MKTQLDQSGNYIYKRICLHYQPHSVDDLPAIIESHGTQKWYKEGKLHRDDLPAVIRSDGTQKWYKEGHEYRSAYPMMSNWLLLKMELPRLQAPDVASN